MSYTPMSLPQQWDSSSSLSRWVGGSPGRPPKTGVFLALRIVIAVLTAMSLVTVVLTCHAGAKQVWRVSTATTAVATKG